MVKENARLRNGEECTRNFHQISFRKIKCREHSRERGIYESRHQDRRCHLYWDRSWDLGKFSLVEWRVCNKSIRLLCPMMASEERLRTSLRWSPRIHRSNVCRGREPTERRPAGTFLALKIRKLIFNEDFQGKKEERKKSENYSWIKIKISKFQISEIDRRNILLSYLVARKPCYSSSTQLYCARVCRRWTQIGRRIPQQRRKLALSFSQPFADSLERKKIYIYKYMYIRSEN